METRERILDEAAKLLATPGTTDVSTRAVCEAAGVTAPTLYHHFGDKEGLLDAVVAEGWRRYLASKKERSSTGRPVDDLRRGWDGHVEFGVANPTLYALMFPSAGGAQFSKAAEESYGILRGLLAAIDEAGQLRPGVSQGMAARAIWSAVHGVTSLLVRQPDTPHAAALSELVREAILNAIMHAAE